MPTLLISLFFTICTLSVFSQFNLEHQRVVHNKTSFGSLATDHVFPRSDEQWERKGQCAPSNVESCWFRLDILEYEKDLYSMYLVNRTLSQGTVYYLSQKALVKQHEFDNMRSISLDKHFVYDQIYLKAPEGQFAIFNALLIKNDDLFDQLIARDTFVVALMTAFAVLCLFYARFKWYESKLSSVACLVYMVTFTAFCFYGFGFLPLSHISEVGISNSPWLGSDLLYSCYIISIFSFHLTIYCKETGKIGSKHTVVIISVITTQIVVLNLFQASELNLFINMLAGVLVFYHLISHKDTRYKPFIISMYAACFGISLLIAIASYRNTDITKYIFLIQTMYYLFHVLIITLCIYELADMRVVNFNDYSVRKGSRNIDPLTGLLDAKILESKGQLPSRKFIYFIDIKNIDTINRRHGRAFGNHVLIKLSRELKQIALMNTGNLYRVKSSSFLLITDMSSSKKLISLFEDNLNYSTETKIDICFGRYEAKTADSYKDCLFKVQFCCKNAFDSNLLYKDWNEEDHFMIYCLPERKGDAIALIQSPSLKCYAQHIFPITEHSYRRKYETLCRLHYGTQFPRIIPAPQLLKVVHFHGIESVLDAAMLTKSAEVLAKFKEVELSVNVTPSSLLNTNILTYLHSLPHEMRIRLCLELTEQAFYSMDDDFSSALQNLRKTGVKIALDDFGSGFSSYATLSKEIFDFIKIDGSLVQNVEHSKFKQKMIASIVELAALNGSQVVAEFVETETERSILKQLGVQFGQGYLIHKPQPIENVLENGEYIDESA
ncbi:GGDEF domain-containing phosphodiesterase [Vibrio penaeicida]|uniref:GGDEF domain-containing phosphodiesterase n=1 Tax=Vibrio penaeicida TaxID=104609 RepID=UPI000CE9D383|nr:GGDEF domain-containing phosphodiesterase [Vibrio penaeicida]